MYEPHIHAFSRHISRGSADQQNSQPVRYNHKSVNHGRGEFARGDDGDGVCEVHVHTMEGFWSLLRSWLRPPRGISQEKLPLYLGCFEFVHNVRKRGKALLPALIELLIS
jgi:transposase